MNRPVIIIQIISLIILASCNSNIKMEVSELKKFDNTLLRSVSGHFSAMIFENKHLNIPSTLYYNMQIDLADFVIEGDTINTAIMLDFIKLNVNSIKELEFKVFNFPVNPSEGYIDGSIYIFQVHNPFDVTKIEFGELLNNKIETTIHYTIDFEYERTDYSKTDNCKLITNLTLGNLSIDPDILKADNSNIEPSKELVSQFCDTNEYYPPTIVGNRIVYKMKIEN